MTQRLEIICVGKELLMGKMLNLNSRWLAKRATTLGFNVHRILTITDDIDEISSAVQEAIQRHPRFIITTGGLGPTYDDKTMKGIAKATGRKLEISNDALRQIDEIFKKRLETRRSEFSEQDVKRFEQTIADHARGNYSPYTLALATIPEGARVMFNPNLRTGGLAIVMELEGTTLISLPGVPGEVEAIFEGGIVPLFRDVAGEVTFLEKSLDLKGVFEAQLSPLIDQVMAENPQVYIKSALKGDVRRDGIELYLSTTDEDPKIAENNLNKAFTRITELLQDKDGKLRLNQPGTTTR
jgi:molybdenum cofactor synthesis domain-containing protein